MSLRLSNIFNKDDFLREMKKMFKINQDLKIIARNAMDLF